MLRMLSIVAAALAICGPAHADPQTCDAGSLSCLHEPVGKQCGLGTCLPDGTVMGGGLSCDCMPGTGSSGDTKCSHGVLECLHKDVGSRCGFAGTCMSQGADPMGMTCDCQGGEVPVGPPDTTPDPEIANGWTFCTPKDANKDACAGTKLNMCYITEDQSLMAMDCINAQLVLTVAAPFKPSGMQGLTETINVDGTDLQTMAVVEDFKKTSLGNLVGYKTTDALTDTAIAKLKAGRRVSANIAAADGKKLHSIEFSLHGSGSSISRLQSTCK